MNTEGHFECECSADDPSCRLSKLFKKMVNRGEESKLIAGFVQVACSKMPKSRTAIEFSHAINHVRYVRVVRVLFRAKINHATVRRGQVAADEICAVHNVIQNG